MSRLHFSKSLTLTPEQRLIVDNMGETATPRPTQLPVRDGGMLAGERLLLIALLQEAVLSVSGNAVVDGGHKQGKRRKAQRIAQGWFASKANAPTSLVWCCDHLGLDVDAIRDRVRATCIAKRGKRLIVEERAA
jgi:hypothetical protein